MTPVADVGGLMRFANNKGALNPKIVSPFLPNRILLPPSPPSSPRMNASSSSDLLIFAKSSFVATLLNLQRQPVGHSYYCDTFIFRVHSVGIRPVTVIR